MAQTPWNARFEAVLRQGLPGLGRDRAPAVDVPLETYGLDSLALIGIVGALESAHGVVLAGQVTVPVRALTAGQLWGILSAALPPAGDSGRPLSSAVGALRVPAPWIMG
ncbi:acyl carrier protein [Streptomyces sp. STR69]|uniref:acyl carrier protein n=1 Tax=Streptomyces sp. STR69 TaxID=1796942 RepID=UPI0021C9D39F|nr:acyl carrier protein [Streptomyces sp. STR69]